MIPIKLAKEPQDFNDLVRKPGKSFLISTPQPRNLQWRNNDHWRKALDDLNSSYNGICAYCASFTIRTDCSVDHFVPKSYDPSLAYEWSNFRLSRQRMNNKKGNHRDILDPVTLKPDWFRLNFLTFQLEPNSALPEVDRQRVTTTIDRLELNIDNDYITERIGAVREYCLNQVQLIKLADKYPFIASEMVTQDFDANFLPRYRSFFSGQQLINPSSP